MIRTLLRVTRYDRNGSSPLKLIDKVPKNIPIIIISSLKDQIVPFKSSENIYTRLFDNGCIAHLIKLEKSDHSNYVGNNKDDTFKYYNDIMGYYEKYL